MRALEAEIYEAWLAAWAVVWDLPELPWRVRIVFSQRLQRSLGRCSPRTGSIRLNPGLLDGPPAALREVACHEVAHVATWVLHGRKAAAHGREWKELMQRAGYEPRVRWAEATVPAAVRERRRKTAVYVHSCPVCRAQWIARRTVTTWRCATCRKAGLDGRLTVSKREAGSNAELA